MPRTLFGRQPLQLPQRIMGLEPRRRAADACYLTFREKEIITVAMNVQAMAGDGMLRYGA
jgi:hypothetical protein